MPSRTFITREEKSMLSFQASKDKLILLLGTKAAGDFKLKSMLVSHSKNPRTLNNHAKSSLPVLSKWNNKAQMTVHLFTTWFTEYFKPTAETYGSEKKFFFFKYYWSLRRTLREKDKEINVFMPANTISILRPMGLEVILTSSLFLYEMHLIRL